VRKCGKPDKLTAIPAAVGDVVITTNTKTRKMNLVGAMGSCNHPLAGIIASVRFNHHTRETCKGRKKNRIKAERRGLAIISILQT
jgi:hypothetical protein